MNKLLSIILVFSFLTQLQAQKEDYQWIFNWTRVDDLKNWPDLGATVLDFNYDPTQVYRNEAITLDFSESNAVNCDQDGQLLLYSNQQALYDFNHVPALNGDTINFGDGSDWPRFVWDNENGETRTTGYRFSQGIGIVPFPDNENTYLIVYNNTDSNDDFRAKILYSKNL